MKGAIPILAVLIYGCGTSSKMWTSIDTWFREAPPISGSTWEMVPRDQVYAVVPSEREEAVALLESQSAILLELQVAEKFTGTSLARSDYYLVRGLCLACGSTGGFVVYRDSTRIAVFHHSLTSRALPMTRWPVIVALGAPSVDVYVEVTSDS